MATIPNTGLGATNSNTLFETSKEELRKGMLTPKSHAAAGANADESKMAGTKLQKDSAIKEQLTAKGPAKELAYEQRLTPEKPMDVSAAQKNAQEKMERMSKLSGLGMQVEGLIQKKIQATVGQQPAGLQIADTSLAELPPSQREAIVPQLEGFAQALASGQDTTPFLSEIAKSLGRQTISANEVLGYYQNNADTIAAMALSPETATIGELDLTEIGVNVWELAHDLGLGSPDELAALTIPELQDRLKTMEDAEYSRIQSLNAELQTAVGARREDILRELGETYEVGQSGAEFQMDELQAAVERAENVTIGGRQMTLEQALGDEGISRLIEDAALSPQKLEELKETEPELAAFVEANFEALKGLATQAEVAVEGYEAIQAEVRGLQEAFPEEVFSGIFGDMSNLSAEEAEVFKTALAEDDVLQHAIQDKEFMNILAGGGTELYEELTRLMDDGYDVDTIKELQGLTKKLRTDGALADALGITPEQAEAIMITEPGLLMEASLIGDVLNKFGTGHSDVRAEIAQYYARGEVSLAQMDAIAASPKSWPNVQQTLELRSTLDSFGKDNFQGFFETMFGEGSDIDAVNKSIKGLQAEYNATGSKEAKKILDKLKPYLGDNMKFDKGDMSRLLTLIPDMSDVIAGNVSPKSAIGQLQKTILGDAMAKPSLGRELAVKASKWKEKDFLTAPAESLADLASNKTWRAANPERAKQLDTAIATQKAVSKAKLPPSILPYMKGGKITFADVNKWNTDNDGNVDNLKALYNSSLLGGGEMRPKFNPNTRKWENVRVSTRQLIEMQINKATQAEVKDLLGRAGWDNTRVLETAFQEERDPWRKQAYSVRLAELQGRDSAAARAAEAQRQASIKALWNSLAKDKQASS